MSTAHKTQSVAKLQDETQARADTHTRVWRQLKNLQNKMNASDPNKSEKACLFLLEVQPGVPLSHLNLNFKFSSLAAGCPDIQLSILLDQTDSAESDGMLKDQERLHCLSFSSSTDDSHKAQGTHPNPSP